jgi:hypothetical protein
MRASRLVARGKERLLGLRRASGTGERISPRQQQLAAHGRIRRLSEVDRLERELVEARGLLVLEQVARAVGCLT